jgi:tetratricopeptide (TPR) repeat protein
MRFRQERLFRTPNHPEVRLTMMLASDVFARLGMAPHLITQMAASPPHSLFPLSEMPVHPNIIEHFGLQFIAPDTRYRYFNEGSFTFEEFAHRYMRYEWNPDMAKAFHLFWAQQFEAAVPIFQAALRASPRAAAAHFVLSDLLARQGRFAEAVEPARQAVLIEPDNEAYRKRLDYMMANAADRRL